MTVEKKKPGRPKKTLSEEEVALKKAADMERKRKYHLEYYYAHKGQLSDRRKEIRDGRALAKKLAGV